jgi:signal transduction histidine kinase
MTTLAGRIRLSLGQLRWRLTASYTAVTVGALLVVILILLVGGALYWRATSAVTPGLLLQDLEAGYVPILRPYLTRRPPDTESLRTFLSGFETNLVEAAPLQVGNLQLSVNVGEVAAVVFFGADGKAIDSLPHTVLSQSPTPALVSGVQLTVLAEPLSAALAGIREQDHLIRRLENGAWVGAFPISASEKSARIVGAVAFVTQPVLWSLQRLVKLVGLIILFVTFLAGVMGTLFGSLTARGLLQRVQHITSAIAAWGQGDFSVSVHDDAGDELASLAGDLDNMARQLTQLLDRRQQMWVVEERNRLARDLHDSAKQQAFAASAQLGAARALLPLDGDQALAHLQEAERLVNQVRQELSVLIHELRPPALRESGLASGLTEYARDWAELNDCEIELSVEDSRLLCADVEESLFRVAQEALANVARHSCATRVLVALKFGPEQVFLTVQDNGCGFDFDAHAGNLGVGLSSMRERAQLVGGCLSVSSASGAGTTIEMTAPA